MSNVDKRIAATPVKVPPALKDYLKHAAIDSRRTLGNEIVYRLEQSRIRDQEKQGAKA